ncbi:MAG: hypothetical protein FVQ79_03390 [Planctomycetes bacterium]|nr:hypothetical protein [Planctomycetota bacterium]
MTLPAVQDLVRKSFVKEIHRPAGDVRRVFHREKGDWSSDRKRIVEVDRERFAEQKVEGQASVQREIAQGYTKDIVRKTISVTRVVSGEAYKALTAHKLAQYATQTGKDVVDKIELDMRNFIGLGDGSSYTDNGGFTIDTTTGDGQPFLDTAHTLKKSSTTYTNILSGAPSVSETSLESAEDFFAYNVTDNYGQRVSMKPNTIITSEKATMKNRISRILGSMSPEQIEGSTNFNAGVKNTYRNKYRHLVIEFDVTALNVSNSNLAFYWFLASLGGMPETSLQAYYVSWLSPMVAPAERNQDKWILSYTARACYGIGAVSGKGMLVSKATT